LMIDIAVYEIGDKLEHKERLGRWTFLRIFGG
jgi:hypothetical protein